MAYCTQADIELELPSKKVAALSDDRRALAVSSLAVSIVAADVSLTLNDASAFPSSGRIRIGQSEIATYTTKTGNVLSGLTRGYNNTVAQPFASDVAVNQLLEENSTVITRVIADADALINLYCSKVVSSLPFSSVDPEIRKLSVDISIFYLYSRRDMAFDQDRQRYLDAVSLLKDITNGKVVLGTTDDVVVYDTPIKTNTYCADRIFTMGSKTRNTTGSLDRF